MNFSTKPSTFSLRALTRLECRVFLQSVFQGIKRRIERQTHAVMPRLEIPDGGEALQLRPIEAVFPGSREIIQKLLAHCLQLLQAPPRGV